MTESTDEPSRIVHGGSEAGLRRRPVLADLDFESALEMVRAAGERSFSGEEILALGVIMRSAMMHQAEATARKSGR